MDESGANVGFGAAELGTKKGLGAGEEVREGGGLVVLDEPGAYEGFGAA